MYTENIVETKYGKIVVVVNSEKSARIWNQTNTRHFPFVIGKTACYIWTDVIKEHGKSWELKDNRSTKKDNMFSREPLPKTVKEKLEIEILRAFTEWLSCNHADLQIFKKIAMTMYKQDLERSERDIKELQEKIKELKTEQTTVLEKLNGLDRELSRIHKT